MFISQAEVITGVPVTTIQQAEDAVQRIFEKGCKSAIVTLGEKGTVFGVRNNPRDTINTIHVPAEKVKAVDTTVRTVKSNTINNIYEY